MTFDPKNIPVKLDFIDDPQGRQQQVASINAVDNALTDLGSNPGMLLQADNAQRAEAAIKKAGTATQRAAGGAKTPAGPAGPGVSGQLGVVGAGAGQLASLAGVSGQAGGAIGLLGSSIGAMGAAGAAVAVTMVGLGLVLGKSKKAAEEATRQEELLLRARFKAIDAAGETTEVLEKQIADLEASIAAQTEKVAVAFDEMNRLDLDGYAGGVDDIRRAIGNSESGFGAAKKAYEDADKSLDEMTADLEGLNVGLDSTATAAADAAEALEKQAQAQEDALLKQVDSLGKLRKVEQAAAERSTEANQDRLKAIQQESKVLREQIAVIEASGISGEQAAAKLSGLKDELSALGSESEVVQKAIKGNTQVQKAEAAKRKEIARLEHNDRVLSMLRGSSKRKEIEDTEQNDRLKAMIDFANKVKDIEFNTAKRKFEISLQANRDQERLLRENKQQMTQDFFQDFLGAYQRQNQLAFSLRETQIAAGQQLTDVGREGFLAQQQLRAQTPGAQPLLGGPPGGNSVTINVAPGEKQFIIQTMNEAWG
jgi:hypothetical protein